LWQLSSSKFSLATQAQKQENCHTLFAVLGDFLGGATGGFVFDESSDGGGDSSLLVSEELLL